MRGCIEGDAPSAQFFPVLFEHWRSGRMPVDRLITYYDFADINRAVADSLSGRTVKAVLRIGSDYHISTGLPREGVRSDH